jgi:hypothetical protein
MKVFMVVLAGVLLSDGILLGNDRGAGLDPNGGIVHAAVAGDKGLGVDPNGGVRAAVADQGVLIDPNGIRHAAASRDDGIGIDPNGGIRH